MELFLGALRLLFLVIGFGFAMQAVLRRRTFVDTSNVPCRKRLFFFPLVAQRAFLAAVVFDGVFIFLVAFDLL